MARTPLPIVVHPRRPDPSAPWRGVEECAGSLARPAVQPGVLAPLSGKRRDFIKLMAASIALAGAGCSRPPPEKIVPYVEQPIGLTQGEPLYFATALVRDGYAIGVLAKSVMGRPIKVEGNPAHPASLGATEIFAQAAVLELWDPDRSRTVLHRGEPRTWEAFLDALQSRLRTLEGSGGKGLHVLTGTITSPSLRSQLAALAKKYPRSAWHSYQPANRDNVYEGSRLAFGEPVEAVYRFDRARTILALDAEFLYGMPGRVRYARDFARARKIEDAQTEPVRLYAVECTPGLTGANADHRLALRPSQLRGFAHAVAHRLGAVPGAPAPDANVPPAWLGATVEDLQRHRGASLVLAGDRQPPEVHALAHAMNDALGSVGTTVTYIEPVADPSSQNQSIRELAAAMGRGEVDTLVVLERNPVYDAPADLDFASALAHVGLAAHVGLHADETAARCHWHVPAAHELESWGDARAFDGTTALQQPLIAPLYGGKSTREIVAAMLGDADPRGHEIVRRYWQQHAPAGDFEHFWEKALHDGLIEDSAFAAKSVTLRKGWQPPPEKAVAEPAANGLEIAFQPDPTLGDGRWANNAWLQELPKPLTQLTWDNAVLISLKSAQDRNVETGSIVELSYGGRRTRAAAWIMPGHPDDAISLYLGGGRTRTGSVGNGVGFDAYVVRTSQAPWFGSGATLHATGERRVLATTQVHHRMEGRSIVRSATLEEFQRDPHFATAPDEVHGSELSLYPPYRYPGYAWGMSIDLGACIGCSACTIACQAENNIPVVGREEVLRGREMHWIRVDRYYEGPVDRPRTYFQPVPCMHCERAPCEVVCPVGATVHDAEGLNLQVYNRCVGTRFCSNNCPYKVRRFNFLQYSDDSPEARQQKNPEVTVRMRGVMEKCTYCVQRITNARIVADREGRRIADGDVVTACQAVCPTQAIVFGDLNDPDSAVRKAKSSPLDYALLKETNTRPRTTYLAKVRNANAEIDGA